MGLNKQDMGPERGGAVLRVVAWGKTGENEGGAQVAMHLKHSFRGVQVYGCEKLYGVEIL